MTTVAQMYRVGWQSVWSSM